MSQKPRILILGGVGFIGRNLVKFLVDGDLASQIRVVDKTMPAIAFMAKEHQTAFDSPLVTYMQGDLSRQATVDKAFKNDDGVKFNFVINLAAETKYSQDDETYQKKILDVAKLCGPKAVEHGVDKFIELSHAAIFDTKSKGAADESSSIKPWLKQAGYKLKAEEFLRSVPGLPLVILRPSTVYGPGDFNGITPRLICARVYVQLNEKMVFLWSKDLKLNTVHVADVVSAIWHGCLNIPSGSAFNLSDKGNTTQGSLNGLIENIFGIKTGFHNMAVNAAASMALKTTAEHVNDKHMEPWSDLCQANNITNTPLTPYLDIELLHNKPFEVNGSAIESTGFSYQHPQMTEELLREQINMFVEGGLFPRW